jgi:hypothetical protein
MLPLLQQPSHVSLHCACPSLPVGSASAYPVQRKFCNIATDWLLFASVKHLKSERVTPSCRSPQDKYQELLFASFGQSTAPLRPAPSSSFLASRTRTFSEDCCYLPEVRCPAHASRGTHSLLRLPPNVALPCFGPCLPVGSAHARPLKFPYNVRFAHKLLPIGGFHGTSQHPRYRQETHRCVTFVTTNPTCFDETLHLDDHLLGYGPRPSLPPPTHGEILLYLITKTFTMESFGRFHARRLPFRRR